MARDSGTRTRHRGELSGVPAIHGRYRKKPLVVDAFLWEGNWPEFFAWSRSLGGPLRGGNLAPIFEVNDEDETKLDVQTLHGVTQARAGEWVICGPDGDFWPCAPRIFDTFYEPYA